MAKPFLVTLSVLLLSATLPAIGLAQPALPGDFIADLQRLQTRLEAGNVEVVKEHASAQAERLAGGNAADRWARALYLQLAARAAARDGHGAEAADLLAEARGIEAAPADWRDRRLHDEIRLRQAAGQTEEAARLLGGWLEEYEGGPEMLWRMARLVAELARWEEAADFVDRALDATTEPSATQHELAATLYQRSGRHQGALALLEVGLTEAADAETWRRAAGLAQRLGEHGRAAAIWEAGWRLGVLDGQEDLLTLVKLHLAAGTPARGAERLEEGLEQGVVADAARNRRLLARAWEAARHHDKALEAWRRVAVRSDQGEDWLHLGRLALAWGESALAERALLKARERGETQAKEWLAVGNS